MSKPTPPRVSPSLLACDHSRFAAEIQAVEQASADWLHIDVMDGHFVPNLTFGPPIIKSLRKVTSLPFDVHLMIEHPERSVDEYIEAGANFVTIHAEACVHLHRLLNHIRASGCKAGVSLNPSTPVHVLEHVLPMLDLILIMSVNPGFGGQKFIPEVVPKVKQLRQMVTQANLNVHISVDGGIDPSTAPTVLAAGADVLVAGSAIFSAADYHKAIAALRS